MKKHTLFLAMILLAVAIMLTACVGDEKSATADDDATDDDSGGLNHPDDDDSAPDDTADDDVADDDTTVDDDTSGAPSGEFTSPIDGETVSGDILLVKGEMSGWEATVFVHVDADSGHPIELTLSDKGEFWFNLDVSGWDMGYHYLYLCVLIDGEKKELGSLSVFYDTADDDVADDDTAGDDDTGGGEEAFTWAWSGTHNLASQTHNPVYPDVEYQDFSWVEVWNPSPTEEVTCEKFAGTYSACTQEDNYKVLLQY